MKKKGIVSLLFFYAAHMKGASGPEIHQLHRYIWANYNQFGNKPQVAQQWYKEIIATQPPIYSYKGYINFLFDTGKFHTIVRMIPSFDEAFKQDADMQLIFTRSLERVGAIAQADDKIIRLNNLFKTNQEIVFQAVNSYLRRKEPENALKAIDDLLNNSPRKPNNFIFHFLKAQIHNGLGNKEDALKSIKIALDLHKQFDKGWLFYALLEEERGQLDQAIQGFSNFLELTGGNQEIEHHLMQLMFQQKIMQKKNHAFALNKNCFEQALWFFENKEFDRALKQVDVCLRTNQADKEARLLKIEILSAQKEFVQAANFLRQWITQDPDNGIWYKALHLLCKTGLPYQKAIAVFEDLSKHSSGNHMPLLYLSDLHMRNKTFETSLMYHKKALELIEDPLLKTKILFQMALIHYQTRQFDRMEKVLLDGLNLHTDYAPLLNLLAYHYASNGQALAKAQQLMDTVFKLHNKNPHYIDTQAVIYYQQQDYNKALNLLELAYKKIPNNETILRHLAEAHYQLGNKMQAIGMLEKALHVATNEFEKNECSDLLKQWNKNHE